MSATFIRFVIPNQDPSSQQKQGVFMAFSELIDEKSLYQWELDAHNDAQNWFRDNLLVPDVQSKYEKPFAISWFKSTASEHIKKMRQLTEILTAHEYDVEQLVTTRPGKIVYEDRFQIAAIPFKDTF